MECFYSRKILLESFLHFYFGFFSKTINILGIISNKCYYCSFFSKYLEKFIFITINILKLIKENIIIFRSNLLPKIAIFCENGYYFISKFLNLKLIYFKSLGLGYPLSTQFINVVYLN